MIETYKRFYDKVLRDETFRQFLDADPRAALESIEIEPTPEILRGVENTLQSIRELQKDFGVAEAEGKACVS